MRPCGNTCQCQPSDGQQSGQGTRGQAAAGGGLQCGCGMDGSSPATGEPACSNCIHGLANSSDAVDVDATCCVGATDCASAAVTHKRTLARPVALKIRMLWIIGADGDGGKSDEGPTNFAESQLGRA